MTRRLVIWFFLVIVLVALVASAAATSTGSAGLVSPLTRNGVTYTGTLVQGGDDDARVALIPVYNAIVDGDSAPDGSATGGDDVVRMIEAITEDEDDWAGVILELDTPGGSVLASEEITDALKRLKDETKLPVVAWMRGTAASAGYYISAPTDRIVAAPSTFTGSIGVILQYYVVDELAREIGVEAVTIKSGKLKDIGNPLRKATDEERAVFQSIIDEAYGTFVDVVAKGRDLPEDEVRTLADGRIYTGTQAKELGLVDDLGLRREAYDALAKLIDRKGVKGEDLHVVSYGRAYGFFETLAAGTQPALDTLATAKAVGGVLRGERGAAAKLAGTGSRQLGDGFARLEYRAELG
jgi:protease-4